MSRSDATDQPTNLRLRTCDFFMVRCPSLSIEEADQVEVAILGAGRSPAIEKLWHKFRSAVDIASPSLHARLIRGDALTPEEMQKLLKYVRRMGQRCTPFGSFAGIAIGSWARSSNLSLSGTYRLRARMDMAWITSLVQSLEGSVAIRQKMNWSRSLDISYSSDRSYIVVRALRSGAGNQSARILVTPMLAKALEKTLNPVNYAELHSALLDHSSTKRGAAVDRFLDQLWSRGLFVTDLQPPITCVSPISWIVEKLGSVPEASVVVHQLQTLEEFVDECSEDFRSDYARVIGQTRAYASNLCPQASKPDVQVDMVLGLGGDSIHERVRSDVDLAASTLLRISPMPFGPPYLRSFKLSMLERYGENREVPLLEALHPDNGISFQQDIAHPQIAADRLLRRTETLINLACGAIRDKKWIVEIDDTTLEKLELADSHQLQLPASLELQVVLIAKSRQAIDTGDYQLALGPNVGAQMAGQHFGRFSDVIDISQLQALHEAAAKYASASEGAVISELTYMPPNAHYANVAIRARLAEHETAVAITAPPEPNVSIPLHELNLSVVDGRIRVRWTKHNKLVHFVSNHLLSPANAPAVARFLGDVSRDGTVQLAGFDWGDAARFEFLPRIEYQRLVLSPAKWRLSRHSIGRVLKSPKDFAAFFNSWAANWNVPRQALLSLGDNRLPIDRSDPAAIEEIRRHLIQAQDGACDIHEVLPSREDAWLRSENQYSYHSEMIVPLMRSDVSNPVRRTNSTVLRPWSAGRNEGLCLPGSEWVYLKLYSPKADQDSLLVDHMVGYSQALSEDFGVFGWFFIRYADPDSHIRFRIKARKSAESQKILERTIEWAASLVANRKILRFSIDTYERELHRYGGYDGTAHAEEFFFADSQIAAFCVKFVEPHRRELAVLHTLNCMIDCFGRTENEVAKWLRANSPARHSVSIEYRARAKEFISAVEGIVEFDERFDALMERWRQTLGSTVVAQAPTTSTNFTVPWESLLRSLVHMHCNRAGLDGDSEARIVALWARAREAASSRRSIAHFSG